MTGAASGIGAATARTFAEAGADVALAWFPGDPHDVEPVRRAVEAAGRKAIAVEVDVRRTEQVDALVERCVSELGGIDITVANAGIARKVPLAELDDDAWNLTLDVDLNGAWRLFRAALPHMQREHCGRLIATSSVAGTVAAWPEHPHYAAAKAGLVGLIQNLAVEYGPDGVAANAVAPGVVETPQALARDLRRDRPVRVSRQAATKLHERTHLQGSFSVTPSQCRMVPWIVRPVFGPRMGHEVLSLFAWTRRARTRRRAEPRERPRAPPCRCRRRQSSPEKIRLMIPG